MRMTVSLLAATMLTATIGYRFRPDTEYNNSTGRELV